MENKEKENTWENFSFPQVRKVEAGTIADKLPSVTPNTTKELANGRPMVPYPYKYNTFNSAQDLENYIENILYENKGLKKEWLEVKTASILPFNLRDDVYYTPVEIVSIDCIEPAQHIMHDLRLGETICVLKPGDPLISEAYAIIKRIKNKK
jgi:hypothetical protein